MDFLYYYKLFGNFSSLAILIDGGHGSGGAFGSTCRPSDGESAQQPVLMARINCDESNEEER